MPKRGILAPTLPQSRNRKFSASVGYTKKTITEQVDGMVAPRIDIDEPIELIRADNN